MEGEDEVKTGADNDRFGAFLVNDWAHCQRTIGEIKGRVDMLMYGLSAVLALLGVVLAAVLAT